MSLSDAVSTTVFVLFVLLLLVGASTTVRRAIAYNRRGRPMPVLLPRDRDLLLGLTIPFATISCVRVFNLTPLVIDGNGDAHVWYVLLTGAPALYALARYCYFELFVIEHVEPADKS